MTYLVRQWMGNTWGNTFTAEVTYNIVTDQRRNPLVLTDNITERKFKEIDDVEFNSHLNRSIADLVWTLINRTLHRECTETEKSRKLQPKQKFRNKGKEVSKAKRGIAMSKSGKVTKHSDKEDSGWYTVCPDGQIRSYHEVSDEFFLAQDEDLDIKSQSVTMPNYVKKLARQISSEHSYDEQKQRNVI